MTMNDAKNQIDLGFWALKGQLGGAMAGRFPDKNDWRGTYDYFANTVKCLQGLEDGFAAMCDLYRNAVAENERLKKQIGEMTADKSADDKATDTHTYLNTVTVDLPSHTDPDCIERAMTEACREVKEKHGEYAPSRELFKRFKEIFDGANWMRSPLWFKRG